MNGAFLDTDLRTLVVSANIRDVLIQEEGDGRVVVTITGLDEGIEIVHADAKLWRPA